MTTRWKIAPYRTHPEGIDAGLEGAYVLTYDGGIVAVGENPVDLIILVSDLQQRVPA